MPNVQGNARACDPLRSGHCAAHCKLRLPGEPGHGDKGKDQGFLGDQGGQRGSAHPQEAHQQRLQCPQSPARRQNCFTRGKPLPRVSSSPFLHHITSVAAIMATCSSSPRSARYVPAIFQSVRKDAFECMHLKLPGLPPAPAVQQGQQCLADEGWDPRGQHCFWM